MLKLGTAFGVEKNSHPVILTSKKENPALISNMFTCIYLIVIDQVIRLGHINKLKCIKFTAYTHTEVN